MGQGQQSGTLGGRMCSSDNLGLPGATVTVTSPALQGVRPTVTDVNGKLLAAGAILRHAIDSTPADYEPVIVEGARTTAAMAASGFGPVLKVSEDGLISFYDGTKIWDI